VAVHYAHHDAKREGAIGEAIYASGEQLARGQVFMTPTSRVRHGGVATWETRWELAEDTDHGADRYHVVLGSPTVANPPAYRARRDTFARVDADYRSLGGKPDSYLTYREPVTELVLGAEVFVHDLAAPTKRVELLTAGRGVSWRQCVAGPREGVAVLCQPITTYQPGERRPSVWFRAPAPAVTTASHNRERIELPVDLTDGAQQGSVWNRSAAGDRTLRLFRNGKELPRVNEESWYFDTPPEPAMFRLEHTSQPDQNWLPIGKSTATEWTFPSAAPTDPDVWDTRPRLLAVDYQPGADALGRLPAWRIFDLGVRITSMAGGEGFRLERGTLKFWASTDHGKRWHPGLVVPNYDGTYRVIVPGVVTRPGQSVSVRAAATGAEGRRITQTIVDAYPVR
jgi:hypothetical protein